MFNWRKLFNWRYLVRYKREIPYKDEMNEYLLPDAEEFGAKDFFSNYSSPKNYMRSIFFISVYWITLTIVLAAGATKVSLFSLGYLIGCFIFLWLGNDAYLMPLRRLKCSWNIFITYAALVIVAKILLQIYGCSDVAFLGNYCVIFQLLRIACTIDDTPQPPGAEVPPIVQAANTCAASLPKGEFDIVWDSICLVVLIVQRIVFGSQYFRFLVKEVKAQQILASRGAELIMATQVEEAKAQALYEKEVMRDIRNKMEDLKSDNEEASRTWQRLLLLPHHHQIIRSADKHLFSGPTDDPGDRCKADNWKLKKAFIPDPLGDELERMSEINGITAVFTRWMKREPLYGSPGVSVANSQRDSATRANSSEVEPANQGASASDQEPTEGVALEAPATHTQTSSSPASPPSLPPPPPPAQFPSSPQPSPPPLPQTQDERPEHEQIAIESSFDVIQPETEGASCGQKVRGCWGMFNLIMYSCLLSWTVELNKLSRSYRYVSRRMTVEKNALKKRFNLNDERFKRDPQWRKWVISTLSDTYTGTNEAGIMAGRSQVGCETTDRPLRPMSGGSYSLPEAPPSGSGSSGASQPSSFSRQQSTQRPEFVDPEFYFLKLNIFTQFCRAVAYVFISNTSLICHLVIILNQVSTASLLSLPLPLLTFLWGTLSVPRPTKRFWKTVITYTELVIVVKYVFQFPIWNWNVNRIDPFYYPNLLGIKDITIMWDLALLLALFFHRSMLKSLGQWDASGDATLKEASRRMEAEAQAVTDSVAGGSQPNTDELRVVKSCEVMPSEDDLRLATRFSSSSLNMPTDHGAFDDDYLDESYQYKTRVEEIDIQEEPKKVNCFKRAYRRVQRSILQFFQHVLDTPYKLQTDVYTWMLLCDFINFLILIYGFWAFGSGYSNQTVASFLNENRIPFSVLIMLLLQFASIIVDRALYLQRNIAGKLMFQVVLVIGIHIWLFFALPFSTGQTLNMKQYWPPKAWYVFKCIYFLLSAHQIRSGYPRRVLGNFLTKGFGYANWAAFKVYRAIPLVYDLRLYMDWIWTETTLEFRNWTIMEDIFANIFMRKCELCIEEEYPIPRARPIKHMSKYLTGGAFILLILAVIWGPLLLFSMGKTVGDSNPPVEMEYELEFVGFQPILRMRATAQQIMMINETQYGLLKGYFESLNSQSFLSDYKVGDVAAIRLDGQSNAVWEISPPSKDLLMNHIKNNETLNLKSSWTIFRIKKERSQNFDVNIAGSYQMIITNSSQEFRDALYDILADSSTSITPLPEIKSVVTPPIFPSYIRVPETGQASLVYQFNDNPFDYDPLRPLRLSYIRMYDKNLNITDDSTSWWKADDLCKNQPNDSKSDSFPFWSETALSHCDSLLVVAFNDRLFTGILALLSAFGIIGLYTTFVVFFARLIRSEPSTRVIYSEIPNVDRVYGLIMDIYTARECGEFELEEKLFSKLLFLYRSPEMLIDYSRRSDTPSQIEYDIDNRPQ